MTGSSVTYTYGGAGGGHNPVSPPGSPGSAVDNTGYGANGEYGGSPGVVVIRYRIA